MQAERKDDEYILTLDEQKTRHDERDGACQAPDRPGEGLQCPVFLRIDIDGGEFGQDVFQPLSVGIEGMDEQINDVTQSENRYQQRNERDLRQRVERRNPQVGDPGDELEP